MVNSRQKGCRGELEFRDWLIERGHPARRGQQFAGGHESPDVVSDLDKYWHIEVKRTERLLLYRAMDQAINDALPGRIPVVFHRQNHKEWVAIVRADDLLRLVERAAGWADTPGKAQDSSGNPVSGA
jgi:hypothetical protein